MSSADSPSILELGDLGQKEEPTSAKERRDAKAEEAEKTLDALLAGGASSPPQSAAPTPAPPPKKKHAERKRSESSAAAAVAAPEPAEALPSEPLHQPDPEPESQSSPSRTRSGSSRPLMNASSVPSMPTSGDGGTSRGCPVECESRAWTLIAIGLPVFLCIILIYFLTRPLPGPQLGVAEFFTANKTDINSTSAQSLAAFDLATSTAITVPMGLLEISVFRISDPRGGSLTLYVDSTTHTYRLYTSQSLVYDADQVRRLLIDRGTGASLATIYVV